MIVFVYTWVCVTGLLAVHAFGGAAMSSAALVGVLIAFAAMMIAARVTR